MARDQNALRAGIFIVVAVALAMGIIVGIKGTERLFEPRQDVIISFPLAADVGGLRKGDDLRIGGFKVGAVEDIVLNDIEDPAKARADVHVTLPRKYTLRKDARVMIQTTFTGQSWINIESPGTGATLAAGDRLDGQPAAFTALVNELGKMGPELRGAVTDFRTQTLPKANAALDQIHATAKTYGDVGDEAKALVSDVRGKVEPVTRKTGNFLDRGSEMMVQIRDLIGDTKTDFRTTVANLRDATGTLKDKLPGLLGNMDSAIVKLSSTIDSLDTVLKDGKTAVTDARETMSSVREVIVNNKSKLSSMIASLNTTADNLKGASTEIRRAPWRLLHKPSDKEQANFRVINTARQFADGATQLNEAASALRDAARNPNVSREDLQKLLEQLDKQFRNFEGVEDTLWKDLKK